MTKHDAYSKSEKYSLFFDYTQDNLTFDIYEKGEGTYVYDKDGRKLFDLASQYVNVNIGYGNKSVIAAITKQLEDLCYIKPLDSTEIRAQLSEKIIREIAPPNMQKIFLTCGGSDANDYAVRIAKLVTGRPKVLSQYNGYHGATIGSANLSDEHNREKQVNGEYIRFWGYNTDSFKKYFDNDEKYCDYLVEMVHNTIISENPYSIAAVLLDPIREGAIIPNERYFKELRRICDKYNILLIFDEVLTGFGRTGKWFAFEHYDVLPDMITFAKGVTSSYIPLGGVIVSNNICKKLEATTFFQALTSSFHPVACAAAYANISYIQNEKLIDNAQKVGLYLEEKLNDVILGHPYVEEIRGIGLLYSIYLSGKLGTDSATNAVCCMLKDKGYLTWTDASHILIAPPLITSKDDVDKIVNAIKSVLDYLKKYDYQELLRFYPSNSMGMKCFYFPDFFTELSKCFAKNEHVILIGSANAYYLCHVIGALKGMNISFSVLLNKTLYNQILDVDRECCCGESGESILSEEDCYIFDQNRFDVAEVDSLVQQILRKHDVKTAIFPYSRVDNDWVNIWDVACSIADHVVMIDRNGKVYSKYVADIPWYKYKLISKDQLHTSYFSEKFRHFSNEIELVISGTTQAHYALDLEKNGKNGANMAVYLNGFRDQKLILAKYKERIRENAKVLLTVEYPIFLVDHEALRRTDNELIYSEVLLGSDPYIDIGRQELLNKNKELFIKNSLYDQIIVNSIRNDKANYLSEKEKDELIESLYSGWEHETYPIKLRKYKSDENEIIRNNRKKQNVLLLIDLIKYCEANMWKPVLIGLPFSKVFNETVPEDLLKENYYDCIYSVIDSTGIAFIDYSRDEEMEAMENYMDIWFLNNVGRQKFTSRVLGDLANLL